MSRRGSRRSRCNSATRSSTSLVCPEGVRAFAYSNQADAAPSGSLKLSATEVFDAQNRNHTKIQYIYSSTYTTINIPLFNYRQFHFTQKNVSNSVVLVSGLSYVVNSVDYVSKFGTPTTALPRTHQYNTRISAAMFTTTGQFFRILQNSCLQSSFLLSTRLLSNAYLIPEHFLPL
jgi:hypothetical protein